MPRSGCSALHGVNPNLKKTVKGSSGKFLHMTITNHLDNNKSLLQKEKFSFTQNPYFWGDKFVIKDATKHRLSSAHKLFHSKKLHFN